MTSEEIIATSKNYLIENYGRLPFVALRGEGAYLWDAENKPYIDLFAGFGAGGVAGHCHPQVVEAISKQASTLLSHGNLFTNAPQALLAKKLISHSFPGKVFFCHSGAEADEAALKLVRKVSDGKRYKIISFENCFHGRTMGGLSLCPPTFHNGFGPMLEGNINIPFGDLDKLRAVIDAQCAAVFLEPIQGEGGLNVPTEEFVRGVRDICDEAGLLLVCDEVWTAPARTGKWFAYQHFGIEPDVITLAKALGGGAPLAACVVSEKWAEVLGPGMHGCTMGGNPLCSAAGLATLSLIEKEGLVERANLLGQQISANFSDASLSSISETRGRGAMWGIQLSSNLEAREVMLACLEHGIIVGTAKHNVLRLAPPLTVEMDLLKKGVGVLIDTIVRLER